MREKEKNTEYYFKASSNSPNNSVKFARNEEAIKQLCGEYSCYCLDLIDWDALPKNSGAGRSTRLCTGTGTI